MKEDVNKVLLDVLAYLDENYEGPEDENWDTKGLSQEELMIIGYGRAPKKGENVRKYEWIGRLFEAYGDRDYYRTPDGEIVTEYTSIGD